MALSSRWPHRSPFPSGRYTRTNPLLREFALGRLTELLPGAVRSAIITTFRQRIRYDGNEAIQNLHRQRPGRGQLFATPPRLLWLYVRTELEVSRRVVEAPLARLSRETRNALLDAQATYLHDIYEALAWQLGDDTAQALFQEAVKALG